MFVKLTPDNIVVAVARFQNGTYHAIDTVKKGDTYFPDGEWQTPSGTIEEVVEEPVVVKQKKSWWPPWKKWEVAVKDVPGDEPLITSWFAVVSSEYEDPERLKADLNALIEQMNEKYGITRRGHAVYGILDLRHYIQENGFNNTESFCSGLYIPSITTKRF